MSISNLPPGIKGPGLNTPAGETINIPDCVKLNDPNDQEQFNKFVTELVKKSNQELLRVVIGKLQAITDELTKALNGK